MRQIAPPASSVINSAPSCATATRDRAPPDGGVGGHEPGHEVLVGTAAGADADQLIAGAQLAVPRAVQGDEGTAGVVGAE